MEEELNINGSNDLPVTHFFLYEGKQFPFNMPIFKCFSQYFNSIEHHYEENTNINLLDELDKSINISESVINDFIGFCQMRTISINKGNVLSLHILAKKYTVPSLIKATNNYISIHQQNLAIDLLLLCLKDEDETIQQEYEEIISANLAEYFQDPNLLSLPLPALYRIVTKYQQKDITPEKKSEFIEFLFKCLDHFGREGSILFEHADISCNGGIFLRRLLNDYSEKFDFHFINDVQLKTIYNLESRIIEQTNKMKETEATVRFDIEQLNEKLNELKTENDELRATVEELNKNKDSQIQQIETSFIQMLTEIKEQMNEKMNQQNDLISKLKNQIFQLKNQKATHPKVPSKFQPLIEAMKSVGKAMISLSDLEEHLKKWSETLNIPIENINAYIEKASDAGIIIYDKSINYVRFKNRQMANLNIEYE